MDFLGVHWRFLLVQCLIVGLALLWPVVSVVSLFSLRNRSLKDTALALWAGLIVIIPLLGAAAYWIVNPGVRPEPLEKSHHE